MVKFRFRVLVLFVNLFCFLVTSSSVKSEKISIVELPPPPLFTHANEVNGSAAAEDAVLPCPVLIAAGGRCRLYCEAFRNNEHLIFCFGGSEQNVAEVLREFADLYTSTEAAASTTTTSTSDETALENFATTDEATTIKNETVFNTATTSTATTVLRKRRQFPRKELAFGIQSSEFETLSASVFEPVAEMVSYIGYFSCLYMTQLPDMSNLRRVRELMIQDAPRLQRLGANRLPTTSSTFVTFRRTAVTLIEADSLRGNIFYLGLVGDGESTLQIMPDAFENIPSLNFLYISNFDNVVVADDAFSDRPSSSSMVNQVTLNSITHFKIAPQTLRWLSKLSRLRIVELLKLSDVETIPNNSFVGLSTLQSLLLSDNRRLMRIEADAFNGLQNVTNVVLEHSPLHDFDTRPFLHLSNLKLFGLQTRFPLCTCALRTLRDALQPANDTNTQWQLPFNNRATDYECIFQDSYIVIIANATDEQLGCSLKAGEQPDTKLVINKTAVPLNMPLKALDDVTVQRASPKPVITNSTSQHSSIVMQPASTSGQQPILSYKLNQELSFSLPPACNADLENNEVCLRSSTTAEQPQILQSYTDAFAVMLKAVSLSSSAGSSNSGCSPCVSGSSMPPILVFKGESGEKGFAGIHGLDGLPGLKGDKGVRGSDGVPGTAGSKGETGDRGERGITGTPGEPGEKGSRGMSGPPGAYGEAGEKGQTGVPGPQGPPGPAGEQGEAGSMGPMGSAGERGEKGDIGEKGEMGFQGWPGPKGDKGDPAAIGVAGVVGIKGEKGQRGSILLPPAVTTVRSTTVAPPALITNSDVTELSDTNSVFFEPTDEVLDATTSTAITTTAGSTAATKNLSRTSTAESTPSTTTTATTTASPATTTNKKITAKAKRVPKSNQKRSF